VDIHSLLQTAIRSIHSTDIKFQVAIHMELVISIRVVIINISMEGKAIGMKTLSDWYKSDVHCEAKERVLLLLPSGMVPFLEITH
jgi:hypothetical protein